MADGLTSQPLDALQRGEHACLIYDSPAEHLDALARTLSQASERNQRVLWMRREPDTGPVQELLERMDRARTSDGLPVGHTLRLMDTSMAVTTVGTLDRAAMIQLLREETVQALDDGHTGLQVIQEMDGWIQSTHNVDAVKRYETALSTFLPGSSCSVLCLYDRECCTPDELLTLLEVHPHVLVDGEPWENIYAISPEDLLELDVPQATLRRRLQNLVEHREAEEARRMHTSLVELLHDVVWAGHEATTVDEVIHIVLEQICERTGWPLGHAYRFDEETGDLEPTAIWYLRDQERFQTFRALTEATRFPLGVGLPGRVAEKKKAIWIPDVQRDPDFLRSRMGKELGVRSAFAAPIVSNGTLRGVLEFFSPVPQESNTLLMEVLEEVGAQLSEVLERKETENDLRLLETAVSHLDEAILILSPDLTHPDGPEIVYANPAVKVITGFDRQEVRGRRTGLLFGPETDDIVRRRAARDLSDGDSVAGELIAYRKDGSEFVLQHHVSPVRDRNGRITHLVAIFRDVTDERRAEEAIRRADHDSLSGLPNRDLFMRRLERSVERVGKEDDERFAVLFMDLDRFKVVNDSLGHLRGDQLLVSLARRLERTVRPGDTVARFGGDEFVILLDRVEAVDDVIAVAHRIGQELEAPFSIGGRSLYTTASIGIALSDTGYTLPEDVLRDADAAMYRAKSKGGGTYEVFDRSLYDDAVSVLRLETELHRAVERGDFELRYQPIVSLQEGRTLGFEALVRWNHPDRGLLPPSEFLGLAEETGLIVPIGRWVLDEAGRQLQSWQDRFEAATHLSLSVNLSAREFGSEKLVSSVRRVLRDHNLFQGTLQIEITENTLIDRPARVEQILHEFREMGVHVCLDDFGTGYSSLSYLHRFPVKVLKIDRLFIRRLADGNGKPPKRAEEIVRAILALARNLDLDVTAEGVETRKQLHHLRRMDCPNGQGFYFSRPLPASDVEEVLRASGSGGIDRDAVRASRRSG